MRGLAPSRQFHSVYQDKHEKSVRSSSYGSEELKICEGIKERTDDEDDDEGHTAASYDSSDGESSLYCVQCSITSTTFLL